MKQYLYLFINVGCIIIPFIFSFLLKHKFYKQWRYFIPANIIIAILFIIWDHIFVEMGVWGFRSDYLTGLFITQNIPLEEGLFFICIPYACVLGYDIRQVIMTIISNTHINSNTCLQLQNNNTT